MACGPSSSAALKFERIFLPRPSQAGGLHASGQMDRVSVDDMTSIICIGGYPGSGKTRLAEEEFVWGEARDEAREQLRQSLVADV